MEGKELYVFEKAKRKYRVTCYSCADNSTKVTQPPFPESLQFIMRSVQQFSGAC